jgi:hypothetical protein
MTEENTSSSSVTRRASVTPNSPRLHITWRDDGNRVGTTVCPRRSAGGRQDHRDAYSS